MTFTVHTIGPRASSLATAMRSWRGIETSVRQGLGALDANVTRTGSVLVLVDDEPRMENEVLAVTARLAAEGTNAFLVVTHQRPHLTVAEWDSAARLNYVTQTPVIWPVDGTNATVVDLLHSYASAMAGWGNIIGFDVTDLATIAASPCVGMFGRWDIRGNAVEFARRYGRQWGPPPRAAFLTVRAGLETSLMELSDAAISVMGLFSLDDDFLFTSNIHSEPRSSLDALLTVFCGPRRRPAC